METARLFWFEVMKMTKYLFMLTLGCCAASLSAQQYIWVSNEGIRKTLRVGFGATQWSIKVKDSSLKVARGIHLANEVKIISGFTDMRDHFAVHDAFYFDLNMGVMSGKGRGQNLASSDREGRFGMTANFGYLGVFGYRNKQWAAMAGLDFRWHNATIGDYTMPHLYGPLLYFSRAFVARGEWRIGKDNMNQRLVGMVWWGPGGGKRQPWQSVRLELPLGEEARWWLCAQYSGQKARGEDLFRYGGGEMDMRFSQWMIGLRIQGLP